MMLAGLLLRVRGLLWLLLELLSIELLLLLLLLLGRLWPAPLAGRAPVPRPSRWRVAHHRSRRLLVLRLILVLLLELLLLELLLLLLPPRWGWRLRPRPLCRSAAPRIVLLLPRGECAPRRPSTGCCG